MSSGFFFTVFGDEYDKFGSACCRISRQHTDLPFFVVSNHERTSRWNDIDNVMWHMIPIDQADNRLVKLTAPLLSPFEKTLYIDCDSVVQRDGVDLVFDMLEHNHVVLYPCYDWDESAKVLEIYRRAMMMFGVNLPMVVWQGGIVGFNTTKESKELYSRWLFYWYVFGRQREMPCLSCAVKNTKNLVVGRLPEDFYGYESGLSDTAVIQHNVGSKFLDKFGLEDFNKQEPVTANNDFTWVDFQ